MSTAMQLDTLIPGRNGLIDIGRCNLHDVSDIRSSTGVLDMHGATLTNVSGISSDPEVITATCPITTTVGATTAVVITYVVTNDAVYSAQCTALAKDVVTMQHYSTNIKAIVKNVGGVVSVRVLEQKTDSGVIPATSTASLVPVGTNLLVTIVGEVGATLHWKVKLDLLKDV